ncbi:hypothetical protein KIH39_22510 [Telmatocola sphagniphila]|uniref:Tetratricopeptide repeat protein n=1 Tax=Telmatocola sphagniphila TaxID=1123043 RepID=A0A8E6B476_9BACT|nr:hypothetical protein [Telmatocola sphagniphila]QVL31587.1 hypothetical protein KIH39_22510 [Telmatocola sphagniphila]
MRYLSLLIVLAVVMGCQSTRNSSTPSPAGVETPAIPSTETAAPPVATLNNVSPPVEIERPAKPAEPEKLVAAAPTVLVKKPETKLPEAASAERVDHLMKAAECMEKQAPKEAAEHLRQHIAANPDQIMIRAYLAEMLYKMKQFDEAYWQFDRFTADAQEASGPAHEHLIHCHTRLMEMADEMNEGYAEHLHRGIGLYLLAKKSAKSVSDADEHLSEKLFLKATAEFKLAQKLSPTEARPAWYLYLCWTQLGQQEPSNKALKLAAELALTSNLTPSENQNLRTTVLATPGIRKKPTE